VPITFRINKVLSATSYIWSTQQGTTNVINPNGSGVNDTIISVTFNSNYTSSLITVQAVNDCGVSGIRSFSLTRNNPPTPCLISGPTNICEYIGTGSITVTYSVNPIAGVTNYNWTVPAGASNIVGQGTPVISFKFPPGYRSGNISVSASNGCGVSGLRSLSLLSLNPAMAGIADVIMLSGCPNRVYSYTLSRFSLNSTGMIWTVPTEGTILSGQGTNSITVSYPNTTVSGFVTVSGLSNCGQSQPRLINVKLTGCPTAVTGKTDAIENRNWDVRFFPNPTKSTFNLQVSSTSREAFSVKVFDVQGRLIKTMEVFASENNNFGNELKSGTYMFEITQGKEKKTVRGVKY
jgi:hypothetical protein